MTIINKEPNISTSNPIIEALDNAANPDAWPEIIPLDAKVEAPQPYPIDALPAFAQSAVQQYQQYGQQPIEIVACSALAAMSYAAQGLANVRRDAFLESPLSLNFLVAAESGERKTSGDSFFMKPIWKWERERADAREQQIKAIQPLIEAHEQHVRGVKAKITAASKNGSQQRLAEAKFELERLNQEKPFCPERFQAIFSDVNQQTLAVTMATGHPSVALLSNEAAVVIGGDGMRDENILQFFGFLNSLWDGQDFRRNRLTTHSADITGRRLTCSLMMQPSVLQELLRLKKGQSRNTGFLARFLFAQPISTIGTRLYKEPPNSACMQMFYCQIRQLLDTPLPVENEQNQRLSPPVLELSPEAKALWVEYFNWAESQTGVDNAFSEIKDFASKSADNAARLAGIFHLFENGLNGTISVATMNAAMQIAGWHLNETRRVFGAMKRSEPELNAYMLLQWLRSREEDIFSTATIAQNVSPHSLRKKAIWKPALDVLVEHNYVKLIDATSYKLNPNACNG